MHSVKQASSPKVVYERSHYIICSYLMKTDHKKWLANSSVYTLRGRVKADCSNIMWNWSVRQDDTKRSSVELAAMFNYSCSKPTWKSFDFSESNWFALASFNDLFGRKTIQRFFLSELKSSQTVIMWVKHLPFPRPESLTQICRLLRW